jgi:NADPH:quinone reductase-like Zn-dependent oxidoreductase
VLRPGGLIIGAASGGWPEFEAEAAAMGLRATDYSVAPDAQALAVISRLLESGAVRVHVDDVFDLAQAPDAHRAMETGHTRGKLVLRVAS